ncbi:hypothetical protein CBR_g22364 [Chara braunii]|uniref:Uncharacterized protein n=1 Tax=Chara braunii TaxID=69332 RepID=A0A388JUX7_CHABU|nr:hypothetical protein CBR_g22364 [Chara braunii]|eukprot:GBG61567.1 hypothetical protein CBR_g22364 [Chara braunii]
MAEQGVPSGQQGGHDRSPPGRADVPLSDEDRMRLLISKCYDDGLLPEKFRHGEWVVEGGVRTFVVNARLDELTTNWLKERTVMIIFQGEARDLPMRVREDLIRAYENGWYRQGIFDRNTKRGRVHSEGPNVVSYVARSREIAQWLVAKAEDSVTIRGVEYGMLFKPWLTRTELDERRRLEDETKFWVMAIRVPLRAMFHVESMVETAMGHVINSQPPEQDRTRPKLMNLKFDLVKEAEGNFEPELSIRLGQEVLRIKFVCKHTPWRERCKWWFHTADDGCPRADEDLAGGSNGQGQRPGPSRPDRTRRSEDNRELRLATRQEARPAPSGGPAQPSARATGTSRGAVSGDVRGVREPLQPSGMRSGAESSGPISGDGRRPAPMQVYSGRARGQVVASRPPSALVHASQPSAAGMMFTGAENAFQPYMPRWGLTQWQSYGYHPFGVNFADMGFLHQGILRGGQVPFHSPNFDDINVQPGMLPARGGLGDTGRAGGSRSNPPPQEHQATRWRMIRT